MIIEDFIDDIIQYIKISLSNNEEYKNDKIYVDEAYKTNEPKSSGIYVFVIDEYESTSYVPLGEENNPKIALQLYFYAKKQKHNEELITNKKMCYYMLNFINNIFDRNIIKHNNNNIISIRRASGGQPMPLDKGTELCFAVSRYDIEIQKNYEKIYAKEND